MVHFTSGLAIIYILYCLSLFLFQRQMIYPGTRLSVQESIRPGNEGIEKIWLDTSYGKIESWYMPPEKNSKEPSPVVIFAHGNGELIDYCRGEFKKFLSMGIGVLLVEYPGYGRSEGSPSEKSITETFIKAYDTITARPDIDSSKVVLYGRSLGGGAVCALASHRPCDALILQSTFTSIRDFAMRFFAPRFIVLDSFDNLSFIKSFTNPVLIIHGTNDEIVPYDHGVTLYEATQNGHMISYNCGHNNCPPDRTIYWQDIKSFLLGAGVITESD